jgi:hypothetical protein
MTLVKNKSRSVYCALLLDTAQKRVYNSTGVLHSSLASPLSFTLSLNPSLSEKGMKITNL